ncbi:MAG: 30S ribosomal protein S2 [Candidatus Shikimatogenerans sp. Tcar]|uniref:Small ribosomal subunit protein uS2 n=1 Tax=Candidatus Shikimatogenerans sp. Tcar TaxID=3158565 RepID=A0AAU7QSH3_9FLAO
MKTNIIKDIINNKIHIGHLKKYRNIYMKDYIINVKNGVDIINPFKFLYRLKIASKNLTICSKIGGVILYFGNKIFIKDLIKKYAMKNNMPFINKKWSPGLLTNMYTTRITLMKKNIIKNKKISKIYNYLPIKEQNKLNRDYIKIKNRLNDVKDMKYLPMYLIITNINGNENIIKEANKMKILIIGIVDTNTNPNNIDFPIPANDDLKISINYILNYLTNAITIGKKKI